MSRIDILMLFVKIIKKDPTLVLGLLSPFPKDQASAMVDLGKHIAENTPEETPQPAPDAGEGRRT